MGSPAGADAGVVLRPRPGMLCGDGEIFVRIDGELLRLRGRHVSELVAHLLHLVDGRSSQDEIVRLAGQRGASSAWAARALQWLVAEGLCVRDRPADPQHAILSAYEPQIRYFALHASLPTDIQDRLGRSRVTVIGLGYLGSLLVQSLARSGIGQLCGIGASVLTPPEALLLGASTEDNRHQALARWIDGQRLATRYRGVPVEAGATMDWEAAVRDCDLAVIVAPPMSVSTLTTFNRAALDAKVRFLSVAFDALVAAVGPLVIPEETACLTCRELRRPRRETDDTFRSLQEARAETLEVGWHDETFLMTHLSAVADLTASEMVISLSGCREPMILGREMLVDVTSWRTQAVPVLKVPRCWDCGRTRRYPPLRPFAFGGPDIDGHAAAP